MKQFNLPFTEKRQLVKAVWCKCVYSASFDNFVVASSAIP